MRKERFLGEMLGRLLIAYDDDGCLVDEYYNNIVLPELSEQEFAWLKEASLTHAAEPQMGCPR